ncbi:unnamed protein product, partial [Gulo gulo]
ARASSRCSVPLSFSLVHWCSRWSAGPGLILTEARVLSSLVPREKKACAQQASSLHPTMPLLDVFWACFRKVKCFPLLQRRKNT